MAAERQRTTSWTEGRVESWWTVEPIQPCSARKLMFGRTDIASLRGGIRRFGICHPAGHGGPCYGTALS